MNDTVPAIAVVASNASARKTLVTTFCDFVHFKFMAVQVARKVDPGKWLTVDSIYPKES